ncbi:hypothetical protein CHLNCDRAFT_144809 [Chlorella variabilis]|uniref:Uncharacterized protein n=1 Tax=Chlorella variabilis TaxID=554065 RepID=E1ZD21_CHLVA|nr:hypothetical protein CHLNCDRAFT_144809 [Chlorella variabilis]EFN56341.1 hypothetical protein CHLNCDRAFT_144809 [Chlorella variabilis]|eukprot:XP_005848443.1 hypothetical protein CHLNCDRAFT_144809 [Chlorella variabilis]
MATTTCRASLCCARAQQQQHHQQRSTQATPAPAQQKLPHGRRQLLGGLAAVAAAVALRPARPAAATGIESIDLPQLQIPEALAQKKARNQDIIDSAEKSFQESDLLRTLKERSEANRGANKKALEDRYCMRQAELGVGDCGGLRLIPGMTKSGVQKRPEWMNSLFGMEEQE